MGGIHGKTRTEEETTSIARESQASNVIDGGVGSTVQMTQITGSDGANVTVTDHDAVKKAFDLADNTMGLGVNFLSDALDSVNSASERNYDFAENVAIPLNAQMTEDFTRYAIIGAVVISLGYFSTKIKWSK